jgi:hypothetical protein
MTQRWPWHFMGLLAGVLLLYPWLAVFSRVVPLPHVHGGAFALWFFGALTLSILAGWRGSRWWYLITGCFALTLVLIWIGQFIHEGGGPLGGR